ncbi:MAG: MBL fold metallo-hydrolase [Bryobacter sp.]
MELKFWGVRSSIPTPAPENLGCGGNTTGLEVRAPLGATLIIDGGTGARMLGLDLLSRSSGGSVNLDILTTHFHWDHIQGIPFFAPLYKPKNPITFHTSKAADEMRNIPEGQMTHPYFPVSFGLLGAQREFSTLDQNSGPIAGGAFRVRPFALNHPQGCSGYRIETEGGVIVHACDHEHGDPEADRRLLEMAQGADLLVYDLQFTPAEYDAKKGWGHSTWLEGTRVAKPAGVKRLLLTHHDPSHSDAFLEAMLLEARQEFPNTDLAKEGQAFAV